MLLFSSFLSVAVFSAIAAPQLKIGNSGYEIISINEKNPEDSLPLASKLTLESASRFNGIGSLSLEKATDPIDDDEEALSFTVQQHKRHYDPQHSLTASKTVSESQANIIDVTSKQSSNQKSNIYLTVGIPRSFTNPTSSTGKESQNLIPITEKNDPNSQSKDSFDDSDSREESRSQEKLLTKSIIPNKTNVKKPKSSKSAKQVNEKPSEKIRIEGNDSVSSAMFQSDFELADLKDEEKITALVSEANRALSLIDSKSDFQIKPDRIEAPTVKSGFTMVTHFPSIQIHHQKTSYVPLKEPAMFSSIYPAGFDIPVGDRHLKPAIPKALYDSHLRADNKKGKSKKNVESRMEDHNRFLLGHEFNELRRGTKKIGKFYDDKTNHKLPSVLLLDNMNHDVLNDRASNLIPIPISFPFSNQQPSRVARHRFNNALEMKSIPLITSNHFDNSLSGSSFLHPPGRWERIMTRNSMDLPVRNQRGNDDHEYPDSDVHQMVGKPELKGDFFRNYLGKMSQLNFESPARHLEPANELLPPNGDSSKDLIIGIVQEVEPEDLPETIVDAKKENTDGHEMHDAASSKMSCKQMKPPGFYDFLAKFSNILLGKALKYESDVQAGKTLSKLMEITKKPNSDDDEIFRFLR